MIDYKLLLKQKFLKMGLYPFVSIVLEDPDFESCSGSGKPTQHHYGDGGLIKHTNEVLEYCEVLACQHNSTCVLSERINPNELYIAAIWHDFGKVWDYQKDDNGVWGKHNDHARTIHHVSRSAIEWERWAGNIIDTLTDREWKSTNIRVENITHAILAHHGKREYGSPVSPKSREAWMLHLADSMSARMSDCETTDRF